MVQNMPTKMYYAIVNLMNISSLEVVLTGVNEYLSYFPHLLPDLGGIRPVIRAYNVESTNAHVLCENMCREGRCGRE